MPRSSAKMRMTFGLVCSFAEASADWALRNPKFEMLNTKMKERRDFMGRVDGGKLENKKAQDFRPALCKK